MPGQVVSEWAASCVAGRTMGAGGSRPEAGNRLIILPESRRREPNALMVETMKPEKEGGRVPPRPSLFIMWQKSRSAPPFIPPLTSLLKEKEEEVV